MEFYSFVSSELSRSLTLRYSTSFHSMSKLFEVSVRPHIFNIYGWVQAGQAIADMYRGADAAKLLSQYKKDTYAAIKSGFSVNPIIHSFAQTARSYGISRTMINPFFASLTLDLKPPARYTKSLQTTYLHGSCEVIALMCLKVVTGNDSAQYQNIKPGVKALSVAFKKVNMVRNFASDTARMGCSYFPEVQGKLTEHSKRKIIDAIRHDFTHSLPALHQLPKNSRMAITVAARYYYTLLEKLDQMPASNINEKRVHVPEWRKAQIFAAATANHKLRRTVY